MISVIVPVYNIENYIERCILSVLHQTYTDFELLLINDGSTDSSYEICKHWAQKDTRIKLFTQENQGVSAARNHGLDMAQGEFIYFIDADDWIASDCFEKMLEKMSDDIDLVSSEHHRPVEDGGSALIYVETKRSEGTYLNSDCLYDAYKKTYYSLVVWGKLYRKALWEQIRFQPLSYSEDTYAVFEVFQRVQKLYILEEPLYYYFQRRNSVSHQKRLVHYEEQLKTIVFQYQKALESYPEFLPIATEAVLAHSHYMVKLYCQFNKRKKAFELIEKMKHIYKSSCAMDFTFADRLLILPKSVIYFYGKIKSLSNREPVTL